ncbi:hypothetical protein ONZ45_g7383 [Pleurotus djamor]|nr:hypothetical protein ONZ45_g7383 [Pleurotus djamor]
MSSISEEEEAVSNPTSPISTLSTLSTLSDVPDDTSDITPTGPTDADLESVLHSPDVLASQLPSHQCRT